MMREHAGVRWIGAIAVAATALAAPALRAQDAPPGFIQVLRSEINWMPHPTISGAQFAILLGDPSKAGPLVIRVKLPPNSRIMPHTHPDARTYTVLAGEWKLGFGDKYTTDALRSYPPGSLYRLPAGVAHFQASGQTETVVQIDSVGPSATVFINPADDPRKK